MIVFNKTFLTGKEIVYIQEAMGKQTSGNGYFTKKNHEFFREKYGFKKSLLTTSCTDALEMAALLLDLKHGDEVIIPSFTFVSSANPFILRGAKVVFADSLYDHPNIDPAKLESLITKNTRAIVVVHYAGVAVDMDAIMAIANKFNLFVVEDAAQAINAFYKNKPLGSIGHFGCFSFHDTKNVVAGEGGMIVINDERFNARAEIIWEKGTNRSAFIRGEVDKYGWVDIGSSFLPSEITAAFLFAQLEAIEEIHTKRSERWNYYMENLMATANAFKLSLPVIPDYATHNSHIFYLLCDDVRQRDYLSKTLKNAGIQAFFHYPSLHLSKYYLQMNKPRNLSNAVRFSERLIRLPLYIDLEKQKQNYIVEQIRDALYKYPRT